MIQKLKKVGTGIILVLFAISFCFLCFELWKGFFDEQRHLSEVWNGKFLPKIEVERPVQNERSTSPLFVSGKAGASWFSEKDSFDVRIKDSEGVELGLGKVYKIEEKGEGQNPEMFSFRGNIGFKTPTTKEGFLELIRHKGVDYDDTYPQSFVISLLFEK